MSACARADPIDGARGLPCRVGPRVRHHGWGTGGPGGGINDEDASATPPTTRPRARTSGSPCRSRARRWTPGCGGFGPSFRARGRFRTAPCPGTVRTLYSALGPGADDEQLEGTAVEDAESYFIDYVKAGPGNGGGAPLAWVGGDVHRPDRAVGGLLGRRRWGERDSRALRRDRGARWGAARVFATRGEEEAVLLGGAGGARHWCMRVGARTCGSGSRGAGGRPCAGGRVLSIPAGCFRAHIPPGSGDTPSPSCSSSPVALTPQHALRIALHPAAGLRRPARENQGSV